jgi:hypothetical protein
MVKSRCFSSSALASYKNPPAHILVSITAEARVHPLARWGPDLHPVLAFRAHEAALTNESTLLIGRPREDGSPCLHQLLCELSNTTLLIDMRC